MRRGEQITQPAELIHALDQERWERQLDHDASSGKLDFLLDEARNERENGTLKVWPALQR
jgi:hypothetical protein